MSDQWGLVPLPLGDTFAAAPGAQPNQPLLPFGGYIEGQASGGSAVAYTATGLAGSYSVTGRSASVVLARKAAGLAGSYTVTGQSATVVVGRKAAGLAGSYTVTGVASNATYTPGPSAVHYTATGLPGSYTYSGIAATVTLARKAAGSAGSYSITGQSATVVVGRKASGSAGSYSVTGQSATGTYTAGSVAGDFFGGQFYGAGFFVAPVPIAYSATGLPGSYTISGNSATAVWSGEVSTQAGGGSQGRKKRVYIERDGKILLFNSAAQAALYVSAEKQAQQAIDKAQESSRKGPESAPVAFKSNRPVPIPDVVDVKAIEAFYTDQAQQIQKLVEQRKYEELLNFQINLNAELRKRYNDAISLLLMAG